MGYFGFAHIRGTPFILNKVWSTNETLAGIDDVCHFLETISSSCRFWYKGIFPRSSIKFTVLLITKRSKMDLCMLGIYT